MASASIRVVLVDTSPEGFRGSMRRYAKLVEDALSEQKSASRWIEFSSVKLTLPIRFPKWLPGGFRVWVNHLWIFITSRNRIMRCQPDLVHVVHVLDGSYGYIANRLGNVPTIATVHDLIPLLQQQGKFGPDRTSFLANRLVKMTVNGLCRCSALIAVSGNTRRDLVDSAGIETKEIRVVPNPLDEVYLEAVNNLSETDPNSEGDHIPLVLHVGNNGHYKNREGVLRIFSRIRQDCDAQLVMAGAAPSAHLVRMVEELGLGACVEYVEDVNDAALRDLYQQASILLFPSIYEGFGWPPLEAMACGCPVVCSSEASLPEVVGNAALMAPADDEDQLAVLCLSVLNDPVLAEALVEKGWERARQFTAQRMGKKLLAIYDHVIAHQAGSIGQEKAIH